MRSRSPPTTLTARRHGSDDYLARYSGVFSASLVVEARRRAPRGREQLQRRGHGPPALHRSHRRAPVPRGGRLRLPSENESNERDVLKADVSKFLGSTFELKVGGDREKIKLVTDRFNGGAGQRIYIFNRNASRCRPAGVYRHRYYVDDSRAGLRPRDPSTWLTASRCRRTRVREHLRLRPGRRFGRSPT